MTKQRMGWEGGTAFLTVNGFLGVLYAALGVSYLADPAGAVRSFSRANRVLGGVAFTSVDVAPWRYVAAIGMVTLGLMCLMLVVDLRRNHPVLVPAAFFKSFNAAMWFWYWHRTRFPVFLAAGLLDCLMVGAMVAVTIRAYRRLGPANGSGVLHVATDDVGSVDPVLIERVATRR